MLKKIFEKLIKRVKEDKLLVFLVEKHLDLRLNLDQDLF